MLKKAGRPNRLAVVVYNLQLRLPRSAKKHIDNSFTKPFGHVLYAFSKSVGQRVDGFWTHCLNLLDIFWTALKTF